MTDWWVYDDTYYEVDPEDPESYRTLLADMFAGGCFVDEFDEWMGRHFPTGLELYLYLYNGDAGSKMRRIDEMFVDYLVSMRSVTVSRYATEGENPDAEER